MNEIIQIKDQLEKAFYGGAWHGPSVMEALSGISSEKAAAKSIPGVHSIWEIVLHIYAWQNAVKRRLLGDPANLTDEEDWQQANDVSETTWNRDLIKLKESMEELTGIVGEFDQSKLIEKTEGHDYSNYFMLHGLVQHEVYHAGQIAVLKKALK